MITNGEAGNLQAAARAHLAAIITAKIGAIPTDQTLTAQQIAALVALAGAADNDAARTAMNDATHKPLLGGVDLTGHTNDQLVITNGEAGKLQVAARAQLAAIIKQIIKDLPAANLQGLIVLATSNNNANDIRQALNTNKANLGRINDLNLTGHINNDQTILSDNSAIEIRKLAIQQAFTLKIKEDLDHKHFVSPLTNTSTRAEVETFIKALQKENHYQPINGINLSDLDDAHIDAIKTTIVARKDHFINEHIKAKITETSRYPGESHPKLMDLITPLALDKKQALLNEKGKLDALFTARTANECTLAARECGFDSTTFSTKQRDDLIEENYRNRELRKVGNSKIAEILGRFPINLDENQVIINNLNSAIVALRDATFDDAYDNFITQLYTDSGLDPAVLSRAAFDKAFKDPARGQLGSPQDAIKEQIRLNQNLYVRLTNNPVPPNYVAPTKGEEAALYALARLEKTGNALTVAEIKTLTDQLAKPNVLTYKQFATPAIVAILKATIKDFDPKGELLFKDMFDRIKGQYKREEFSKPDAYADAIKDQKARIQEVQQPFKAFEAAHLALSADMRRLIDLPVFAWLDPRTEAMARQHATELYPDFVALNKFCQDSCVGLRKQLTELAKLIQSVPPTDGLEMNALDGRIIDDRKDVNKHRATLQTKFNETATALAEHEQMLLRLNGNPLIPTVANDFASETQRKGLLKVLEEAKELKKITPDATAKPDFAAGRSGHDIHTVIPSDPTKTRQKLIQDEVAKLGTAVPATGVVVGYTDAEAKRLFAAKGKLNENELLAEVMFSNNADSSGNKHTGLYTEEAGKSDVKHKDGREVLVQPVTITVQKYPSDANEGNGDITPTFTQAHADALKNARVEFSTRVALSLLVSMGKVPTADDQIVITGASREQVGMLWAALVQLGKVHPEFKFNEDAIRVSAACFDPKEEKSWGRYKSTSFTKRFTEGSGKIVFDQWSGALNREHLNPALGNTSAKKTTETEAEAQQRQLKAEKQKELLAAAHRFRATMQSNRAEDVAKKLAEVIPEDRVRPKK